MSRNASMLLALAAAALAGCTTTSRNAAPVGDDGVRFAHFKDLVGDWVSKPSEEMPPAKVSYRLTSGGSTVMETVFAGTPHEMVTMYTVDRGQLGLTHYCALGNQPHMLAQPSAPAGPIEFDLDSLGNGDPATHMHMHHAQFTFVDPNHLNTAWTLWKDGKAAQTVQFELTRAN